MDPWVSRYQNVSILDNIGAKDDGSGGDSWSYKTWKAPVNMSPPANQHPVFLQTRCLSCRPSNSVKALKGKLNLRHCHEQTITCTKMSTYSGPESMPTVIPKL